MRRYIPIIIIMMNTMESIGQFSGNNYMDYQLGNIPYTDPRDLSSHYNQLNLAYQYNTLRASIRYEHFLSQNEESSYYALTKYLVQYLKGKVNVRIGTFNETLGNGLLMRGYDIPGAVLENEAYRSRYGFYRDLQGFSGNYSGDVWYFKGIIGKSLSNTLPPVLPADDRRIDLIEAAETGVSFLNQTAGMIIMRNTNQYEKDLFYSFLLNGSFFDFLSYNAEFAHNAGYGTKPFALGEDERFGMYMSINAVFSKFGVSAEYKNYRNLLIGAGISDPPTGVREHKYKVLNRSTHVPRLTDERGFQLESYYSFTNGSFLTGNFTHVRNEFSAEYNFNELFLEYSFYPGEASTLIVFGDYANDEINRENIRIAGGSVWEFAFSGSWSSKMQLEYQFIKRTLTYESNISNGVVVLGVSRSPDISLAFTWELSNDPFINNPSQDPALAEQVRHWLGFNSSYHINSRNILSLFAGQRRGGPACTSGVCYEVLSFSGIEISYKTLF